MRFVDSASRLAGQAGLALGWAPDLFWNSTPAELMALVHAGAGDTVALPDRATIASLMEAFPDG